RHLSEALEVIVPPGPRGRARFGPRPKRPSRRPYNRGRRTVKELRDRETWPDTRPCHVSDTALLRREVESRVGSGSLIGTVERATSSASISIRTGCGPRSAASGTRWLGDDRPAPGRGTAFAHTCVTSSLDRFPQRGPSGDLIERPCDLGDD